MALYRMYKILINRIFPTISRMENGITEIFLHLINSVIYVAYIKYSFFSKKLYPTY